MAVPSSVTTSLPATITASGEADGVRVKVNQFSPAGPGDLLRVRVSGTYGTATLVVETRLAGMSLYYPVGGVNAQTLAPVQTGGSIALADNTSYEFRFPVGGCDEAVVYASALASGSIAVEVATGPADVVTPPVVNATTTLTSLTAAQTIAVASATALTVGPNGATNPTLQVATNTASAATGLKVTGAAAAGGLALAVVSSGTNENLTVDAKGSGTLTLNGTATGAVVFGAAAVANSSLKSVHATGGIGYATGAGGAVTQASSRTTGVTVNTVAGAITLVSAAGSATPASFTVTNSAVAATDTVIVSQKSGTDKYVVAVTAVAAGSFQITSYTTGGTTTEQPVFNFAVIKAVAA